MKAGQILSLYGQYFLPEEAVVVLSQLQDDTPPVAWNVVAPVLERSLGRSSLRETDIDTEAMAAASLRQEETVGGRSVSARGDLGGRRIFKTTIKTNTI